MDADKDALYWDLRLENEAFLARQRWFARHLLNGTLKSARQREQMRLARQAEALVAERARELGYRAHLTTNNCPFDVWVADEHNRAARVEVKISTYARCADPNKGGRYQAHVRQHLNADVVVFIARNGRDWPFIIPMEAIGRRRNIAIWSYCPGDYQGQWSPYLEAWDYLDQAVANSRPQARQLALPTKCRNAA